jgi:hypothetical protein
VAGAGRLAELGQKRPSRLGITCWLHGENAVATGNTSRGSGWWDGGRRGAHGGGVRPQSFGEESLVREGGQKGEKELAILLTATWSS